MRGVYLLLKRLTIILTLVNIVEVFGWVETLKINFNYYY
jgi:hypothetical protein